MVNDDHPGGPAPAMVRRIGLLDLDPDLVDALTPEDRAAVAAVSLPVVELAARSVDVTSLLEQRRAFGAIVLEGMLLHYLQVGAQPGLRILGPGDVVNMRSEPASGLLAAVAWRAAPATRVAVLGAEFLYAVREAPGVLVGLQNKMSEQLERLATQLMICQMPRVEDRLLAMLWLLAESFGRVTPAGTTLPLVLTHGSLGALVGARRPTVTLALGELVTRGSLVHQDRGWLLCEQPPKPHDVLSGLDTPRLLERVEPSRWMTPLAPGPMTSASLDSLADTVERLRAQHARNLERARDRLRVAAQSYERSAELKQRIRRQRALRRPQPPSS